MLSNEIVLPWRRIDLINVLLQSLVPIPFAIADFAVAMLAVLRRHLVECSPLNPTNLPWEAAMFFAPEPEWTDGKTLEKILRGRGGGGERAGSTGFYTGTLR